PAQSKSSLARRKARDEGREHGGSATRDEREKEAHPGSDRQRGQWLFLHVGHQLIFDIPRIGTKFLYLGLALGTQLFCPQGGGLLGSAITALAGRLHILGELLDIRL